MAEERPEREKEMEKTPEKVIEEALENHLRQPARINSVIKKVIGIIEKDSRLPTITDKIGAFCVIVLELIKNFPGQGYEDWKPMGPRGAKQGPKYDEAIEEIRQWSNDHSGFRD